MTVARHHIEFILAIGFLIVAGWLGGFPGSIPALGILFFLWRRQERYLDLFLGFLLILVFSDTLSDQIPALTFAQQLKNFYLLGLTLVLVVDREKFRPMSRLIYPFIPFFIVASIALVWSETLFVGFQKTLSYLLLFICVPNYTLLCYRREGSLFFSRLVWLIGAVILISVGLKYGFTEIGLSHGGRMRGIFGNPNGLGVYIFIVTVLFTAIRSYYSHLFHRFFILGFYLMVLVVVYWSGSRGALFSVILFISFVRLFRFSQALGIIAFIAVMVYFQQVMDGTLNLIASLGFGDGLRLENLQEGSGRIIAWNFAWESIQEHFYLGRGFSFDEHLMRSNYFYLSRLGHEGGVHNTYLILWLNTGVIGLALYLYGFFKVFFKGAKWSKFALPGMFGIMFSVMFEPWLASSLNPFTSLVLITVTMLSTKEFIDETQNLEYLNHEESLEETLVPA